MSGSIADAGCGRTRCGTPCVRSRCRRRPRTAPWLRRAQVDAGERPGITSEERAEIKALKQEVAELRRANEILKAASAFSRPSSAGHCGARDVHQQAQGRLRGRAGLPRADRERLADRPGLLLRGRPPSAAGQGRAGRAGRGGDRADARCGWNELSAGCSQGIRLSSRARATASVRLAAPSLPRTWPTCFLTVLRVTTSSRAMA